MTENANNTKTRWGDGFDARRRAVHNLITSQILRRGQSRPFGSMGLSDLHPFVPLKTHLARVRFAADADVKQAVTWLQIFAIIFFSTPECKH